MSNDITTGNRAARRRSGGQHRKVQNQAAAALVAATAVTAGLVLAPSAGAAPTQGGTTGAGTQGGTTSTPAPAPAFVLEVAAEPATWVPAPAAYQPETTQWRELPNYDYETQTYIAPQYTYLAPVQIEELHLPVTVTPTAPIIAPRNTIRFGDSLFEQPNWISDIDAQRTNNTSAILEAQTTDFWRSVGVETSRAERLAAAQVAGGVTGAIGGATAAGIPAAVVGGLIGGTIGGVQGAYLGAWVPTPIPGLPVVTSGVAGTAGGAAIGAAVAGVPAAAIGGLAGGAAGVAAGTNFGAGDLTEPTEVKVEDVQHDAIVEQTAATLAEWENSGPVGAVAADAVHNVVETAPVIDQQVRDLVAAQPGGAQIVEQVDTALNEFFTTVTPGLAGNLLSTAVGDGIAQHGN